MHPKKTFEPIHSQTESFNDFMEEIRVNLTFNLGKNTCFFLHLWYVHKLYSTTIITQTSNIYIVVVYFYNIKVGMVKRLKQCT